MENKNNKNNVNDLAGYKNLLEFCLEYTKNAGRIAVKQSTKCRLLAELKESANFRVLDKTLKWVCEELIDNIWEYPYGYSWEVEILDYFETKDGTIYYGGINLDELIFIPHNGKREIPLKSYKNFDDFIINFTYRYNTLDVSERIKSELKDHLQYVIENYNRENNTEIKLTDETVENAIDIIISTVWDDVRSREWDMDVPITDDDDVDYYVNWKIEIDDLVATPTF